MTMAMMPPARSETQRMEALAVANRVRSARAREKARIKREGRDRALEILADPPAAFGTMKVWDVLIAVPKMGRTKVNRLLMVAQVSPSKTLGGLTERQREALAGLL